MRIRVAAMSPERDRWIARAAWLVMAIAHAPALLAAAATVGHETAALPRLLFLLASEVFFALKVVDVDWLRLQLSARAKTRLAIIVALLHADVAHRQVVGVSLLDQPPQAIAWIMAIGVVAWRLLTPAKQTRRATRRKVIAARAALTAALTRYSDTFDPTRSLWARSRALHRAPPEPA